MGSYDEQFRKDAIQQILERGYPVKEVSERLGVSESALYHWCRTYAKGVKAKVAKEDVDSPRERALKAEIRRLTEERDILKKAAAYFAKGSL